MEMNVFKEESANIRIFKVDKNSFIEVPDIHPGDIIETNSYGTKCFGYIKGKVTAVSVGTDIINHGHIFFDVIDMDKKKWLYLKAGEEESFVHFEWSKYLQIVEQH